jgi:SAM-dependent methyltransferase
MSTAQDYDERVKREAELFNEGLKRDKLDGALEYSQLGPARLRRDAFIQDIMTAHEHKRVLELGSQAWTAWFTKFGLRPSQLTCINISERELFAEKPTAESLGLPIEFKLMDAHNLEFADNTFDLVYGVAILHHLRFEKACEEIARVLKPGGQLLFVEPLRLNPVARIVRALTPEARTPDELPLAREELAVLDRLFNTNHLYVELFHLPAAMVSKLLKLDPNNSLTRGADALDRSIAEAFPSLGAYYRTIAIHGRKKA